MQREQSISTLNNREIEQNKQLFTEMSKKILYNDNYQKILFILFCMATYACILPLTNYPSQKNLPDFICLTANENQNLLNGLGLYLNAEIESQPKTIRNKINENYASLFIPAITNFDKLKIIKNEKCVNQYCQGKQDELNSLHGANNLQANPPFSGILIANYESIYNYVTQYDSMCDYESFFGSLTTIINTSRIVGNIYFSNLSDKSGRLIAYKYNIYLMLGSYALIFIFTSSRVFFFIFISVCSTNISLYFLIISMASESMNQTYFSLFNTAMSAIFSLSGIVSLLMMVFVKNVYYLYFLQLIFVVGVFYFSKEYILESFAFLIKKNLFEESLRNLQYLNKFMDLKIEENPINKEKLEKLEMFVQKHPNGDIKKGNDDYEKSEANHFADGKEKSIKKIDLVEMDDFYNNNKKAHLISDKSYKHETSLKESSLKNNNNNNKKSEFLQKVIRFESIGTSTKSSKENALKINKSETISDEKLIKGSTDNLKAEKKSAEAQNSSFEILYKKCISFCQKTLGPYTEIIANPKYFWTFLKFLPIYIAINVIYYGQIFNVEKISSNVYAATFIIFSAEFIGEIIAAIIVHNSERKKILNLCLLFNGALYFIGIFTENMYARYLITLGGSISITIAFIALYIFAAETFDVEVKNTLTSLLTNSSTLFMIFFPYLIEIIPNIFIIFSFICFLAMNMTRYFDETYKADEK